MVQRHRNMLMEATLVVAMVMQRYRLDLMPGQMIKAHLKGTLRPRPAHHPHRQNQLMMSARPGYR